MRTWKGSDHTRAQLYLLGTALAKLAKTMPGVSYFNMGANMSEIPLDVEAESAQGLYVDALHLSDVGSHTVAGIMLDRLS